MHGMATRTDTPSREDTRKGREDRSECVAPRPAPQGDLVRWDFLDRRGGYFYVAFGWVLLIALPVLMQALSAVQLALLFGGGVLDTVGAVLFGLERPRLAPQAF